MQRRLQELIAAVPLALSLACTKAPGSIGAVLAQAKDDGHVTIREVPPGLPAAAAGVEVGDEILLIDGRDVRAMSPDQIHRALEGDVGSTVRLTLLRRARIERVEVRRGPLRTPH